MKPNSQTSRQSTGRDEERSSSRLSSNHPLIDYRLHTSLSDRQFGCAGSNQKRGRSLFAPGFREVSNKFFNTEARQYYVFEALFFAIIVAVSAWPIVSMIRALAVLVK
jgi:hypothetical protein